MCAYMVCEIIPFSKNEIKSSVADEMKRSVFNNSQLNRKW